MAKPKATQTKKRTQVIKGKVDIITSVAANDAKGSHGTHGTLNRRGRLGWLFLKRITQIEANANAISAPMVTKSAASPTSITPAQTATVVPQIQTDQCGVLVFGCTNEKIPGTRPSRDIAYQIRVCPY